MLLHVIEAPFGVNCAVHRRARLQNLSSVAFHDVQNVAGLLVFHDLLHAEAR